MHSVVVMEMPGGTDRRRSLVKRAFSDGKSKRKGPKTYSPQLSQSFYEVVLGFLLFNKKSDQQFCAISIDIQI